VSALLFEGEPAAPDVMARPPRPPESPLMPRRDAVRSIATGALLASIVLLLYATFLQLGEDAARGIALAALVPGTLWIAWAERAGERSWKAAGIPRTGRFWLVVLPVALSIPVLLAIPSTAGILHARFPAPGQWAIALGAATVAVIWRAPGRRSSSR
jgi:Ca2+-transporting ATPase